MTATGGLARSNSNHCLLCGAICSRTPLHIRLTIKKDISVGMEINGVTSPVAEPAHTRNQ
jgi:hypothetical protein